MSADDTTTAHDDHRSTESDDVDAVPSGAGDDYGGREARQVRSGTYPRQAADEAPATDPASADPVSAAPAGNVAGGAADDTVATEDTVETAGDPDDYGSDTAAAERTSEPAVAEDTTNAAVDEPDFADPAAAGRTEPDVAEGASDVAVDEPDEGDDTEPAIAEAEAGRDGDDEDHAWDSLVAEPTRYQGRWDDIQAGFVDEPRRAVADADVLVAEVIEEITAMFTEARSSLEDQWSRGDEASTEDLRVAFRRYRSFFQRLLTA